MKPIDMTHVYKQYRSLWVALKDPNSTEVVASGKTLKQTLARAQKKGIPLPLMTQIPERILPIVGSF